MEKISKLIQIEHFSAYVSSILAGVTTTASAACVQRLHGVVPPFQLNVVRYITQVIISLSLVLYMRHSMKHITKGKLPWFIVLAVYSIAFNTLQFTAAEYLPLGNLMVTYTVSMYIGSVVFSRLLLGRDTHLMQYAIFAIILLGELFLIQPCPLFTTPNCYLNSTSPISSVQTNDSLAEPQIQPHKLGKSSQWMQAYGYALSIFAALTATLRGFIYKREFHNVPTSLVTLGTGLLGLIGSFILTLYIDVPTTSFSNSDLILLVGHGITACASTLLIVNGQRFLFPVVYSIIQNSRVVCGFILQYCFPNIFLTGNANALEAIGAGIVTFGIILYVFLDSKIIKVLSINNL